MIPPHSKGIIAKSIFICFFLCFICSIHYFIYFSLSRFVDMSGRESYWLAITLGILSLTFPIATLFAGLHDNKKTRYVYYLSAIWLGVLQYLFLSFLLVWWLAFIAEWIGLYVPLWFFGLIGIIISGGIVIYGVLNARIISITRIDVSIKNLPKYWEWKKIAHISDVHIGHILRSNFVTKIVTKINLEKPEILCITGDLFDGMDGKLEHIVDPLSKITAPNGILYVDGNHETYLWVERAFASMKDTNAKILRDEILTIEWLDFIGIDYPEPGMRKDIATAIKNLENFDREKPSILLYHEPKQIKEIAKTWVDLELCGHTHKWQMWPFGILTKIVYKWMDYGLTQIGDFSLYTSSGVGTWWPPMRVWSESEIVIITLHKKS